MKHKLLIIPTSPYASVIQYEATLTHKIFKELRKYYILSIPIYFHKTVKIEANVLDPIYKIEHLKFEWSNPINKLLNLIWLNWKNFKIIQKNNDSDLIWMGMTSNITANFAFLYPLLNPRRKFYVQLYTSSVNPSKLKRDILDFIISINLKFFKYIGGGRNDLNIKRYRIADNKNIPVEVGMPDYGYSEKDFSALKLVHIGTLNSREIWKSVSGVGLFKSKHPEISISYDIIGTGAEQEISKLKNEINNYNLDSIVKYHGRLSISEVKEVFRKCNIGVCYIPINEYFQHPSTKTVEYCLAGMAVISTKFKFCSEHVTEHIGVLCDDNPESFAEGLGKLHANRYKFNSLEIRKAFEEYDIENTMKTKYIPFLEEIIRK